MLDTLQAQMQPGVSEVNGHTIDFSKAFPTKASQAAVLLELLGLAHADADYHVNEQDFISNTAQQMGVAGDALANMENWVVRQFDLMQEAQQFMEG